VFIRDAGASDPSVPCPEEKKYTYRKWRVYIYARAGLDIYTPKPLVKYFNVRSSVQIYKGASIPVSIREKLS
jgi:hypothetical protein